MYYVTKTGTAPGIYKDIESVFDLHKNCETVCIQSFEKLKDARAFIRGQGIDLKVHSLKETTEKPLLHLYVDGSDHPSFQYIGVGCVMVVNQQIIEEVSRKEPYSEDIGLANHEYTAALCGLEWAYNHGYRRVRLYSDCVNLVENIEKKVERLTNRHAAVYQNICDLLQNMETRATFAQKDTSLYMNRADWLSKVACGSKSGPYYQYYSLPFRDENVHLGSMPPVQALNIHDVKKEYRMVKPILFELTSKPSEWIVWKDLCVKVYDLLKEDERNVSLSKLRKSNIMAKEFEFKRNNKEMYIRRRVKP